MSFTERTNIFGNSTVAPTIDSVIPPSQETTAAGKLIDKLKGVADTNISRMGDAVKWSATAALQGQNTSPESLINRDLGKAPNRDANSIYIKTENINDWLPTAFPAFPAMPAMPAMPARAAIPALPSLPAFPAFVANPARSAMSALPVMTVPSMGALPAIPALPVAPARSSIPALPSFPALPALTLPTMPTMSPRPAIPALPSIAALPSLPTLSTLPSLTTIPTLPSLPALPALPAMPALPTLPSDLTVDYNTIRTEANIDLNALRDSWFARYLPDETDVSALDTLINNVFNGTTAAAARTELAALATAATAALLAIKTTTLAALNTSFTAMRTRITDTFTTARTGVDAAIATGLENIQDIAWVRARDAVAREAARREKEALNTWAARGFTLPGGVVARQVREAQQKTLEAAVGIAAEQAVKQQTVIIDMAKMSVETFLKEMEVRAATDLQSTKAEADAYTRFAELELDANKTNARIAFEHLGLVLDFTKFAAGEATKYRLGVINGMNGLINAYASTRSNQTEYVNAIAQAKRQLYAVISDYYRASLAGAEISLRGIDPAIRATELALRAADMSIQADDRYADRGLRAAELSIRAAQLTVESGDRAHELSLRGADLGLRAADTLLTADDRRTQLHVDTMRASMEATDRSYDHSLKGADLSLRARQIGVDIEKENMNNVMKHIQIAADFIARSVGHHVQAAQVAATVYAQTAGNALSGLNGVAQIVKQE